MPAMSRSEPLGLSMIAQHHAILGFERIERALIREVASLAVGDRHFDQLTFGRGAGERSVASFPRGQ